MQQRLFCISCSMELDVCVGSQSSIHGTLKSLKKEHGLFKVSEDISPHQKSTKMHRKKSQIPSREKLNDKPNNIAIAYVAGLFKKLRRILSNHDIPVHFGSSHAIRQKCFVNSKTKLPNTS